MKLYHGTSEENANNILDVGFRMPGIVFLDTTIEGAKEHGDIILEVEAKDEDVDRTRKNLGLLKKNTNIYFIDRKVIESFKIRRKTL